LKIKIDRYTEEQAREYADNEAEIQGFKVGDLKWQKYFKEYLSFAYSTMSVGRNPRKGSKKYNALINVYPDIFGETGYAGKLAKNYYTQSGERGVTLESIQDRILSAVNNLVRLHENAALGVRNTTKGNKQGKIPNEDMSELQYPDRSEFSSDEEYKKVLEKVFFKWFQRDMIANAVLEGLEILSSLTKEDVEQILSTVNVEGEIDEIKNQGREEFVKRLRSQFKNRIPTYKKVILGN